MTDEQIIKALECLSGNRAERGDTECAQCCFNSAYCVIDVAENALELINRQKAENERLMQKLQQPQTEAINEFAEMLKNKMLAEDYLFCEPCDMADIIDNLVKEMTEDGEEK